MKIFEGEKKELIGKQATLSFPLTGKVYYLSGIEQFDPLVKEKPDDISRFTTFAKHEKGMLLEVGGLFKKQKVGIPFEIIKGVSLESKQHVVTQKEKSVLGRAVLGGLLLGPIGAMVGGMSGLQASGPSIEADHFLTFSFDDDGKDYVVLFHVKQSERDAVEKFFRKVLPDKFAVSAEAPTTSSAAPEADPYERLKKLAELKEKGILTEDEFLAQKAKLLS